ncbi:MAG TPA: hypothetical protein EYG57_04710 [Planctomycetes bacterium]|nr:hypothetical protein [Planctomycetota bacterium]
MKRSPGLSALADALAAIQPSTVMPSHKTGKRHHGSLQQLLHTDAQLASQPHGVDSQPQSGADSQPQSSANDAGVTSESATAASTTYNSCSSV